MRLIDINVLDGCGAITVCVDDLESEIRIRLFLKDAYKYFESGRTEYIKPSAPKPTICHKS